MSEKELSLCEREKKQLLRRVSVPGSNVKGRGLSERSGDGVSAPIHRVFFDHPKNTEDDQLGENGFLTRVTSDRTVLILEVFPTFSTYGVTRNN